MKKVALIKGQEGSFLTESLIEKGCEVYDIIHRSSSFDSNKIEHLHLLTTNQFVHPILKC